MRFIKISDSLNLVSEEKELMRVEVLHLVGVHEKRAGSEFERSFTAAVVLQDNGFEALHTATKTSEDEKCKVET